MPDSFAILRRDRDLRRGGESVVRTSDGLYSYQDGGVLRITRDEGLTDSTAMFIAAISSVASSGLPALIADAPLVVISGRDSI